MVAFHAASGAAAGWVSSSRLLALASGPVLHVGADQVPHRHPRHEAVEVGSGLVALGLLVRRRGLFDAATVGALAAVAPDFEHLVPQRLRPRKLFHRLPGRDRVGRRGLSVATQLVLSAAILAPMLRSPARAAHVARAN